MWSFIVWTIPVSLVVYIMYDLFLVKHDSSHDTDAQKICKIYKNIKLIKKMKNTYSNNCLLSLESVRETVITIYKYKKLQLTNRLLAPTRLGEHFVEVPYLMNNSWYRIPIPRHIKKTPTVVKVMSGNQDVTSKIREYLGPNEDFHQQLITPKDLGYHELKFQLFVNIGDISGQTFIENQPIIFKKLL